MKSNAPNLQDFQNRLQALANAIYTQCEIIASELDCPRKMNQGRVEAAKNIVTAQIGQLRQFLMEFDIAYRACGQSVQIGEEDGPRRLMPQDWLAFSAHVGHMRSWANGWVEIQKLIATQCPPRRRSLECPKLLSGSSQAASLAANDRIFRNLHLILNPSAQSEDTSTQGCFADIGLAQSEFTALALSAWRLLKAQGKHTGTRFLDVGCGGGLKVLSALEFFDAAVGLELDPAYVASARRLFEGSGSDRLTLLEGDALDFRSYDQFDVIYMYRPISDEPKLQQLEELVTGNARPGAIVIAPYVQFQHRAEELGCQKLARSLYVHGLGKREAASLRREAEFIGTNLTRSKPPLRPVWDPVLKASQRRGF